MSVRQYHDNELAAMFVSRQEHLPKRTNDLEDMGRLDILEMLNLLAYPKDERGPGDPNEIIVPAEDPKAAARKRSAQSQMSQVHGEFKSKLRGNTEPPRDRSAVPEGLRSFPERSQS